MAEKLNMNSDSAKEFMRHIISNNRHLQENGKVPVAVELEGNSGIGKTSIVLQLAKEMGLDMIKLSLSQIEELGDLVGFPIQQFEMCKADDCVWVDDKAVEEYTKLGYSFTRRKRMSYCPPEWIADKTSGGILLLDDYSRADMRFLQAVMELVDRQEYISWKMPNDWHIVLTSNPDNGEYLVNVLDIAQKTRFISVGLKFDIDCWARWAESQKVDGRCINFLLLHPELVDEKRNARSITTFFNSISSFKDFGSNLHMIQMIGEGSVGTEFSTMFSLFINNKLDKIISPKQMLAEKDWSKLSKDLTECIGTPYRADIAYVLSTRLLNYSQLYAKNNAVPKEMIERLIKLTTEDIFADDLKYNLLKGLVNGEGKEKFRGPMMLNPTVVKMAVK